MQMDGSIKKILSKYPFLEYNKGKKSFVGYIYLDEDDKYHLLIDVSNFPNNFPKVIELDERIPRKADRHINKDNSLCFTTPINEEILLKTKVKDLELFFQHILIPFLANNSFYEINKVYKFGEYSHHPIYSLYETYRDILNIDNFELIATVLKKVASGKKYRPNELCYCGSGIKIKNCNNHEEGYRDIKKLSSERLLIDSKKILELRKELLNYHKRKKAPNTVYTP